MEKEIEELKRRIEELEKRQVFSIYPTIIVYPYTSPHSIETLPRCSRCGGEIRGTHIC